MKRGWGSIVRRRRRDGTVYEGYWIRYRNAAGRRTWKRAGRTIEDAEATLAELQARVAGEKDGRLRHLTVEAFAAEYSPMLAARVKASTLEDKLVHFAAAAARFGARPMASIEKAEVEDLLLGLLREGRMPGTVRNYHASLSTLWEAAVARGAATRNVCRGIRLPKAELLSVPLLSGEDLERLYAGADAWLRPLLEVLAETGMRIGEGLALQWPDVAAGEGVLVVRRSKTGKPREIPLTPRARGVLQGLRSARVVPLKGDDRVFAGLARGPRLHYGWKMALERARLPTHLRLHDLRHVVASTLLRNGVDPVSVARLLGNSPEQVLRRYGVHAPGGWGEQAMDALARARGQEPRPATPGEPKAGEANGG